jgi:hypothetical protein
MVARHFLTLLATSHRAEDFTQFVDIYEQNCDQWLDEWTGLGSENTREKAELAVEQLRFFDRLSLWFCCDDRTDAEEFQTPERASLTLYPQFNERNMFAVDPWCWLSDQVSFAVEGFVIDACQGHTSGSEIGSIATRAEIHFRLRPAVSR